MIYLLLLHLYLIWTLTTIHNPPRITSIHVQCVLTLRLYHFLMQRNTFLFMHVNISLSNHIIIIPSNPLSFPLSPLLLPSLDVSSWPSPHLISVQIFSSFPIRKRIEHCLLEEKVMWWYQLCLFLYFSLPFNCHTSIFLPEPHPNSLNYPWSCPISKLIYDIPIES